MSSSDEETNPMQIDEDRMGSVEFWEIFDDAKLAILWFKNNFLEHEDVEGMKTNSNVTDKADEETVEDVDAEPGCTTEEKPVENTDETAGGLHVENTADISDDDSDCEAKSPFATYLSLCPGIIFTFRIELMDRLVTTLRKLKMSTREDRGMIFHDQALRLCLFIKEIRSLYQNSNLRPYISEDSTEENALAELYTIKSNLYKGCDIDEMKRNEESLRNFEYRLKYECLLIEKIAEKFKENNKVKTEYYETKSAKKFKKEYNNIDSFLSETKEANDKFLQEIRHQKAKTND